MSTGHEIDHMGEASGDLTEDELRMLREVDQRRRVTPPRAPTNNEFDELVQLFARRAGIEPPKDFVFRCAGGCNQQVSRRGEYCSPCAEEDRRRQRLSLLAEAYESVSRVGSTAGSANSLAWCRVGAPEYAEATQRARDAAKRAASPEVALNLIERAGWNRKTGNVLLVGPKRIGKSKAAIACAHRILDIALRGGLDADAFRFARGIRVVSGLKLGRARRETRLGELAELERISQCATLLILDEVGFEEDPAVIRDVIYDRCEDRGRPTFITSGRTIAELEERYGPPTIDRLEEQGVIIDLHAAANTKAA
ncbi:ATP-binding protein [Sorangium sp. So ce388]|uniref:ATP-binding protein n=1 Tax=Sorangium sp. So ce388 TaxID=3133309 RepID=UPI003F5C2461